MPRDFNDADRAKKAKRIASPIAFEVPAGLEDAVKAALNNGCLPCPVAWSLAAKFKLPKTGIGQVTDQLGFRISDCQLGCFKVDKNLHLGLTRESLNPKALQALNRYLTGEKLNCAGAFSLAQEIGVRPMEVADAANFLHVKVHNCQLGCW